MKKYFTYILLITFILLTFSCKKNDSNSESSDSSVNAEIQRENASKIEEHLVDISTSTDSSKSPLKLTQLISDEKEEGESDDFVLSEIYRGGSILIKAEFTKNKGTLFYNNINKEEMEKLILEALEEYPEAAKIFTVSFLDNEISLSYNDLDEETLDAMWDSFKTFLNKTNEEKSNNNTSNENELVIEKEDETLKGIFEALIYSDRAVIKVPNTIENDEINSFISYLLDKYPEATNYGSYTLNDGTITLVFSSIFTSSDASSLWPVLVGELNSFFTLDSSKVEESDEKGDVTEVKEAVTSESEKGEYVRKYSVVAAINNSYDTLYNYVPLFSLGLEYSLSDALSIGGKIGYDMSGYIPLSLALRYNISNIDGLYLSLDGGVKIGVRENFKRFGFISTLTIGYERAISDFISIFGEVNAIYTYDKASHFRFGLTIGGRYYF